MAAPLSRFSRRSISQSVLSTELIFHDRFGFQVGVGRPREPGEAGRARGGDGAGPVQQVNDGEFHSLEAGDGDLGGGQGGGQDVGQDQDVQRRSTLARGWGKLDRRLLKPLLTICPPSLQVLFHFIVKKKN